MARGRGADAHSATARGVDTLHVPGDGAVPLVAGQFRVGAVTLMPYLLMVVGRTPLPTGPGRTDRTGRLGLDDHGISGASEARHAPPGGLAEVEVDVEGDVARTASSLAGRPSVRLGASVEVLGDHREAAEEPPCALGVSVLARVGLLDAPSPCDRRGHAASLRSSTSQLRRSDGCGP